MKVKISQEYRKIQTDIYIESIIKTKGKWEEQDQKDNRKIAESDNVSCNATF